MGLINLANILFPEVICLGGGISAADDDLLLDPLRERFHQGCFNKDNPPQLVKASLGNDAGVVGPPCCATWYDGPFPCAQ